MALARNPVVTAGGAEALVSRDSDRLSAIDGIDAGDEARLNKAGYYRYTQIAELSAEEERMLETALNRDRGAIERMQWRDQARMLADGRLDEHVRDYPVKGRII
jgi:predicted flap endonuclease-1-like 5' DNA nuclease